jgi:hypothetical protein
MEDLQSPGLETRLLSRRALGATRARTRRNRGWESPARNVEGRSDRIDAWCLSHTLVQLHPLLESLGACFSEMTGDLLKQSQGTLNALLPLDQALGVHSVLNYILPTNFAPIELV